MQICECVTVATNQTIKAMTNVSPIKPNAVMSWVVQWQLSVITSRAITGVGRQSDE